MINEQLKKIIELEKLKVEREEIDKLEERINKNIHMANQSRDQNHLADSGGLLRVKRKEGRQLVIDEED